MGRRLAKRILLVGWDAADWQMIHPLIGEGKMPTLARLIERGTSGNLATLQPALSPMLWNSIATGKRADKHGIAGFVEPEPDRTGIRPVTSTSRKCKAIWNILTQVGLTSNVISWFASHPAEPILGAIVSDRYVAAVKNKGQERQFPDSTFHPSSLEQELGPLLVSPGEIPVDALLPFIPQAAAIDQEKDDRLAQLASLLARASSVHAAACNLVEREDWDLTAVYYSAIDEFGHAFMPYHPPRLEGVTEQDAAIYQDVMSGCYRFHDMMLESLLAYAGPDTTVMVVSDHGFLNDARRPSTDGCQQPVQWHREFGIACVQGPEIRQGETLYGATLLDVTPTILTMLGLPLGNDMDGRPWLEMLVQPVSAKRIASWEEVPGEAGMHPDDLREDPVDASEAMRHLIDLGYVEAPGDDVEATISKVMRDRKTNLALALSASRRASRAIDLWEELVAEYPDEGGLKIQLASSYLAQGDLDKCEHTLAQITGEMKESSYVRLLLATVAARRGDREAAISVIQKVRQQPLRDPAVLNRLGELLIQLELWDEAELAFRESLVMLEDNPLALNGMAKICLERDEWATAVEHALMAVGLVHFYPAAHYHLGFALARVGRPQDAIAAFETCLAMGYEPCETHYHLAALYRLSNPQKAKKHEELAMSY